MSTERVASCGCGNVDGPARVILWSRAKSTRGLTGDIKLFGDPGLAGRPRRPTSRGAKVKEGSSTDAAIPRTLTIL